MSCDQRVQALTNYNTEHSVELNAILSSLQKFECGGILIGSTQDPHFVFIQFLFSKSCFLGWMQVQT
jgi:hypothetical protein